MLYILLLLWLNFALYAGSSSLVPLGAHQQLQPAPVKLSLQGITNIDSCCSYVAGFGLGAAVLPSFCLQDDKHVSGHALFVRHTNMIMSWLALIVGSGWMIIQTQEKLAALHEVAMTPSEESLDLDDYLPRDIKELCYQLHEYKHNIHAGDSRDIIAYNNLCKRYHANLHTNKRLACFLYGVCVGAVASPLMAPLVIELTRPAPSIHDLD